MISLRGLSVEQTFLTLDGDEQIQLLRKLLKEAKVMLLSAPRCHDVQFEKFRTFVQPTLFEKIDVVTEHMMEDLFRLYETLKEKSLGDRYESRCEVGDQYFFALKPEHFGMDENFRNDDERCSIFERRVFEKTRIEHLSIGYWDLGPDSICCQVLFVTMIDLMLHSKKTLNGLMYLFGYSEKSGDLHELYPLSEVMDVESFRRDKGVMSAFVNFMNTTSEHIVQIH